LDALPPLARREQMTQNLSVRQASFLLVGVVVSGMATCACDGGLEIRGTVVDSHGEPIPLAEFFVEDREREGGPFWDQGRTDESGQFYSSTTIGDVDLDIWVTIRKESFREHSQRVWKDDGPPEDPIELEVGLVPE
jgi:hypothetical protein